MVLYTTSQHRRFNVMTLHQRLPSCCRDVMCSLGGHMNYRIIYLILIQAVFILVRYDRDMLKFTLSWLLKLSVVSKQHVKCPNDSLEYLLSGRYVSQQYCVRSWTQNKLTFTRFNSIFHISGTFGKIKKKKKILRVA